MTDRDTFAAAALTGLLAGQTDGTFWPVEAAVKRAYEIAEVMLVRKRTADAEDRRIAALPLPRRKIAP